ncbi:hypothetical protein ABIE52_006803 [Rhodococcus sp. OAS809]|uniref:hypothetical protein n=1 Tax=Rhodococcus sp. OAS809 TaxID=2663874 RepID=UPI001789A934
MTAPNDPRQPTPQAPLPKSGWWASIPRAVVIAGAMATAMLIVLVTIVIVVLAGDSDADNGSDATTGANASSTENAPSFTPEIYSAEFSVWRDKKTNEIVTPPQRIKITDSLDLTETVKSIGYGPAEQSMPKIAKTAATDSSFPGNQQARLFASADGTLRLWWSCATMRDKPEGADCKNRYDVVVDISGSAPRVASALADGPGLGAEANGALTVESEKMAIVDSAQLPASVLGTDKGTGATTVMVLSAAQPREGSAKVYFIVPDSLKLYVGELESNR